MPTSRAVREDCSNRLEVGKCMVWTPVVQGHLLCSLCVLTKDATWEDEGQHKGVEYVLGYQPFARHVPGVGSALLFYLPPKVIFSALGDRIRLLSLHVSKESYIYFFCVVNSCWCRKCSHHFKISTLRRHSEKFRSNAV